MLYLPDRVLECEIVECRQVSVRDSAYEIRREEKMEAPEQMILSTCSSESDLRLVLQCTLSRIFSRNIAQNFHIMAQCFVEGRASLRTAPLIFPGNGNLDSE
jgi:hypothetical protein